MQEVIDAMFERKVSFRLYYTVHNVMLCYVLLCSELKY